MNYSNNFPLFPTEGAINNLNSVLTYINTVSTNNSLHYSIQLADNWKPSEINYENLTEDNGGVLIGLFKRIPPSEAETTIMVFLLPREMHAIDYLEILLNVNNCLIIDKSQELSSSGLIGEFLSEHQMNTENHILRSIAIKDGSRLYIIQCSVEKKKYSEDLSLEFLLGTKSFKLLNHSKNLYAEDMKHYKFGTSFKFEFMFPGSWILKSEKEEIKNEIYFSLLNDNKGSLVGRITFLCLTIKAFQNEKMFFEYYLTKLKEKKIVFEFHDLNPLKTDFYDKFWIASTIGRKDEADQMISTVIIKKDDQYILISLITPLKEKDIQSWAINRRAYDILMETLKIGE